MSKLILSKHDSVQLFLKTRYINDLYRNPFADSILEDYLMEEDQEEDTHDRYPRSLCGSTAVPTSPPFLAH